MRTLGVVAAAFVLLAVLGSSGLQAGVVASPVAGIRGRESHPVPHPTADVSPSSTFPTVAFTAMPTLLRFNGLKPVISGDVLRHKGLYVIDQKSFEECATFLSPTLGTSGSVIESSGTEPNDANSICATDPGMLEAAAVPVRGRSEGSILSSTEVKTTNLTALRWEYGPVIPDPRSPIRLVVGFWLDGTPFILAVHTGKAPANVDAVPEPSSTAFLICGAFLAFVRRPDQHKHTR